MKKKKAEEKRDIEEELINKKKAQIDELDKQLDELIQK